MVVPWCHLLYTLRGSCMLQQLGCRHLLHIAGMCRRVGPTQILPAAHLVPCKGPSVSVKDLHSAKWNVVHMRLQSIVIAKAHAPNV